MNGIIPLKLDADSLGPFGLFGDYVGGVAGTIISLLTLLAVLATWNTARRADRRSSVIAIVAEILKTHDGITLAGAANFFSKDGVPSMFLREFSAVYKHLHKVVPSYDVWSVDDRIDIAYTFAFYGPTPEVFTSLERHGGAQIGAVHRYVSALSNKTPGKRAGNFKGYQTTIPHYFRNLFSAYTYVDQSGLSDRDKYWILKVVRSKLSNYEQDLLALNIISHFGCEWENEDLVNKYKPISNIPRNFFGFDPCFSPKVRFPNVEFEWERRVDRPQYRTLAFFNMSLTLRISRKPKSNGR